MKSTHSDKIEQATNMVKCKTAVFAKLHLEIWTFPHTHLVLPRIKKAWTCKHKHMDTIRESARKGKRQTFDREYRSKMWLQSDILQGIVGQGYQSKADSQIFPSIPAPRQSPQGLPEIGTELRSSQLQLTSQKHFFFSRRQEPNSKPLTSYIPANP